MDWAGAGAGRWRSWSSGWARSRKRSSRDSGAAPWKKMKRRALMSPERQVKGWRRWRDAAFVLCSAWLVVQNLALVSLVVWAGPGRAIATGAVLARTAFEVGAQLVVLVL